MKPPVHDTYADRPQLESRGVSAKPLSSRRSTRSVPKPRPQVEQKGVGDRKSTDELRLPVIPVSAIAQQHPI